MSKDDKGAFADLQSWRETERAKITNPTHGTITPEGKFISSGITVRDAPERVGKISRQYDEMLRQRKKDLGFTGVFKEAKVLKRHQWFEVIFTTGAVASVGIGAIMALAGNRKVALKQEQLERETEEKNGNGVQQR